jgi:hypothetical protein
MIYTFIAYAPKEHERDLAWAYNKFMRLLPNDDDWACFIDHDAMFTASDWYPQMERIIEANPEYSCLTSSVNRAYADWQIPMGINNINHDIAYHRKIGAEFQADNGVKVVDVTTCSDLPAPPDKSPLSGVVILYKKSAWKEVPFRLMEPNRLTGIDNLLHLDLRDKGHKVGLMCGVYVYHWHRADGINRADVPKPEEVLKKNEIMVPYDTGQVKVEVKKEEAGMDIKAAQGKIQRCKDDNFIVIGAPLPYNRGIDVQTCLWIEYQKRKPNMIALYEPTRFASFGRNNVIHKTLEHLPGVTHVFFIDKDVLPPVDAIERLLAHDKDIIVGATPIYRGEPVWSVMKYDPDETCDNVFNAIPYAELPSELFRAHHFGGTTCLIKRHVLETMGYPWYQDVFAPGALLLGQDLFFTAKAKQYNFELWCDPSIKCEHARLTEMKTVFDECCLPKELSDVKVNS